MKEKIICLLSHLHQTNGATVCPMGPMHPQQSQMLPVEMIVKGGPRCILRCLHRKWSVWTYKTFFFFFMALRKLKSPSFFFQDLNIEIFCSAFYPFPSHCLIFHLLLFFFFILLSGMSNSHPCLPCGLSLVTCMVIAEFFFFFFSCSVYPNITYSRHVIGSSKSAAYMTWT